MALIALGLWLGSAYTWASYHYRRAQRHLARHELTEALADFALCRKVWPSDTETCLLAARTARRARVYDDARRLLQMYKNLGGDPVAIELEQDLARAQRGELKGLEKSLLAAAQKETEESPLIWEALSQGYMETYRWPQASHCLTKLIDLEPQNAEAFLERGWVRENSNHLAEAITDFKQAATIDPDNARARLSLAGVCLKASHPNDAAEQYEWLRQRDPENPAVLLGLARCRRDLGNIDEARSLLDRLLVISPKDPRALGERGKVGLLDGDAVRAEAMLVQSLAFDPRDREVNYDYYLCLSRLGKEQEARDQRAKLTQITEDADRFNRLLADYAARPSDSGLICEIAEIMLRNNRTTEGEIWLRNVLENDPNYKKAHRLLADYYEKRGDIRKALQHRTAAQ
jgi:predicted Zn-dependent protease